MRGGREGVWAFIYWASILKSAAVSAIHSDFNQYRHVQGLCDRLAKKAKDMHGLSDIAICCGLTEAFAAAVFSYTLIDRGDEVILTNETYAGCIPLAGEVPVYVALDPPTWTLDIDKLLSSFTSKTNAIVPNRENNNHFESFKDIQRYRFCTSTLPGVCVNCFGESTAFFLELRQEYERKRDFLSAFLLKLAFKFFSSLTVLFSCLLRFRRSAPCHAQVKCVRMLIEEAGVVAVPGRGFFHTGQCTNDLHCAKHVGQRKFIRFAFCKSDDTLAAAAIMLWEFLRKRGVVGNL